MQYRKPMRTHDLYYDLEKTDEYQTLVMKFVTTYVLFWLLFLIMYFGNFCTLAIEFSGNEFYNLFIMKDKGKTDTFGSKYQCVTVKVKVQQSLYMSGQVEGSRSLGLPNLEQNRHIKVVKSSALRTDHLCTPRNIPDTHL